jgi:hypothetical protein
MNIFIPSPPILTPYPLLNRNGAPKQSSQRTPNPANVVRPINRRDAQLPPMDFRQAAAELQLLTTADTKLTAAIVAALHPGSTTKRRRRCHRKRNRQRLAAHARRLRR